MSQKIKMTVVFLGLLIVGAGLVAWSQYGEYDKRDLPSKIKITATADSGYHVHADLLYYPSRPVFIICTGIFGSGLKEKEEYVNDIPESGVIVQTKYKFPGICKYQFDMLLVACSKSKSYSDETVETADIGVLEKGESASDGSGYASSSRNKIENHLLHINEAGSKNKFYGCDSGCEPQRNFGLDASDDHLNISCKEK